MGPLPRLALSKRHPLNLGNDHSPHDKSNRVEMLRSEFLGLRWNQDYKRRNKKSTSQTVCVPISRDVNLLHMCQDHLRQVTDHVSHLIMILIL